MVKKIIHSLALTGMSLGASFAGLATAFGAAGDPGTIDLPNPIAQSDIFDVLIVALEWAIIIAGVVAVVFIIIGGYQYMAGGEKGVETGRKTLSSAIVGLIIVLLAFVIINTIQNRIFDVQVGGQDIIGEV